MKRGPTGLTIFIFTIGIFAIYLGLGIMNMGDDVSDTGGTFGAEMAALGGLWTVLGMVLAILGVLIFPMGLGIVMVKEWGRKNGILIAFFIAGLCVIAGFIIAYYEFMESIIYFVLTGLALVCGQLLREQKAFFEMGTRTRRYESIPTHGEVRHAQHNVVMRYSADAQKVEHKPMVKCGRCGTMNEPDKESCKMCARPLS